MIPEEQRSIGGVYSVVFSYDSRYLAIGGHMVDGSVRYQAIKIYQTDKFKKVAILNRPSDSIKDSIVASVAFSPDGKYLASGNADKTVKVYHTDGFKEITTLTGHSDSVWSVAFSPDGKYLASGSADKTVKVYHTDGFKEITTLTGHSDSVRSVSFSINGKYLAGGSADKTVKIWRKGVISRQEFEEQEKHRIQVEKETERKQKEQELREYRLKNKLCLECGEKLGFWDKLSGKQYCKRHRR
jgi:WD40 repeat protein